MQISVMSRSNLILIKIFLWLGDWLEKFEHEAMYIISAPVAIRRLRFIFGNIFFISS